MEDKTPVLIPSGVLDGLPTISWDDAMHQARKTYGLISPAEVREILVEEGYGYHKGSEKYVKYGRPVD